MARFFGIISLCTLWGALIKINMADCLYKIGMKLNKPAIRPDGLIIYEIMVPCGKCERCIERRKMEWGFRMEVEMANSKTAYFTTLTYAPEHVPYTKYGLKTLLPHKDVTHLKKKRGKKRRVRVKTDHLTKFFKLLRTNQERGDIQIEHLTNNLKNTDKIKYYAAGEYGENNTKRPHYHAIIFNTSMKNIERSWEWGSVMTVPATAATIAYVMKYLDKRIGTEHDWRVTPEYNVMSEGIGLKWIDDNAQWYKQNLDVLYIKTAKGFMIPMPRYFRLKMLTEDERYYQAGLVTQYLEDDMNLQIETHGYDGWRDIVNSNKEYDKINFKKKTKKRIID